MKKKLSLSLSPLVFILSTIVLLSSCRRINEATELGGGLVPEVDNVTTFETVFETTTDNLFLNDTTRLGFSDPVALGNISNDPEFGQTTANIYFNISAPSYGTYPFSSRDGLIIDSVVLSLGYTGAYGDTNALQTVRVFEIPQHSTFVDTAFYRFTDPDFETGPQLGSKTFAINSLNDSITLVHRDTTRTANVLRIRLDEELGMRFASYDTARNFNGGYHNDSLFKKLFKGLAVKPDAGSGNGLAYFNLSDAAKTNVTVYYRATRGNIKDTASVVFAHTRNGQANIINRTPGGNYASNIGNGTANKEQLYIQSAPGSVATIKIPSLDTFSNNVIHRAELIVTRIPSSMDNVFTPPNQLFLDKINNAGDTARFIADNFVIENGVFTYIPYNAILNKDNTYRFNITRHVQDIITRKNPNSTLRLYAPFETTLFYNESLQRSVLILDRIANGRVVVAGGNFPDPNVRMRLRIVYSKL